MVYYANGGFNWNDLYYMPVKLREFYWRELLKAKEEETKQKRIAEKDEVTRFFRGNSAQLKQIFDLRNLIVDPTVMIVRKVESIKSSVDTFVKIDTGVKVTGPEGFVAVDRLTGGALKLVDRMEFSQNNFNAVKNWSK